MRLGVEDWARFHYNLWFISTLQEIKQEKATLC